MSLRRQAVALRGVHPASHICSALKINDTALKRWSQESEPAVAPSSPAVTHAVVELPVEAAALAEYPSAATTQISIALEESLQLRVQGQFSLQQILDAARAHQQGVH